MRDIDGPERLCHTVIMDLIVHLPDDLATRLSATGGDLPRRLLEALAAEAYRNGDLTKPELRRLLGLQTRAALDGFLNAHAINESISVEELQRQLDDLERLGL